MAEAIVSIILEQLVSVTRQQIEGEVKLVLGVDDELRKLTSNIRAIGAVLEDAEGRQVKENAVRDWLDKLKDVSYEIDDLLDEWNTSTGKLQFKGVENAMIRKVCSLIPRYRYRFQQFVLRHDIALKIKDLNKTLDVIDMEKNMLGFCLKEGTVDIERSVTTSIIDMLEVQGRDYDKHTLFMKLLNESSEESTASIISIVGKGGIGKTALAQLAFNDDKVKIHFDKRIWVCVSKPFDKMRITLAILESLEDNALRIDKSKYVLQNISEYLERKKFLLILDDVWIEDTRDWEQLRNSLKSGCKGSRILVTTRTKNVANIIGTRTTNIISLGTLSNEDSWSLFSRFAFFERTKEECKKLENIGRKIVGKCKGLPLAIKILGSLLLFKTNIEQWQSVLDSETWELEKVKIWVLAPLLLSYYDLPSMLKKCFSFCAIFPKNYEIEKDKLIKLWISQNYLMEDRTKDMELIGEEYFKDLAMRSFFQEFKKNDFDGSIESFKMHDIVHNFAQFLTKNECFNIETDSFEKSRIRIQCIKMRHLVMQVGRRGSFLLPICNEKKLRSLVVKDGNISSTNLSKLFANFTCLRRLDLIDCSIKKISKDIKKLIHLRYLDFSQNDNLIELPETLCELYNLQILNVSFCGRLVNLPQDMGKLINLRHLINEGTNLSYMPKGIERLTCLRTLSELKLNSSMHGAKTFNIECLEHLSNLWSVNIHGLKYTMDVVKVKRANLKNKRNLFSLGLFFDAFEEARRWINRNDEIVLEALEPPLNLVKLKVRWWYGDTTKWPHWMMSLTQLKELNLRTNNKFKYLPSLGRLPSLELLDISVMNIKRVGNEFLGTELDTTTSSFVAFPKLKHLRMWDMRLWKEWDIIIKRDENVTIMPSLISLTIFACRNLKKLPDQILQTPTLKQLEIKWCFILEKRYREDAGEDWHKISHIPISNIII